MNYIMPLYRPPSEAKSLIIQLTSGCSHNGCHFCSMYKGKVFQILPMDEILHALEEYPNKKSVKRVFLADGDALVLSTNTLLKFIKALKNLFPNLERVSTYATPADILRKTDEELHLLYKAGLTMAYMGIESGADVVLKQMNKGVDSEAMIMAGRKIRQAGFVLSVTAISGLGSVMHLKEHALETARVVKAIEPEYFSLLALMIEPGTPLYEWYQSGDFTELSCEEILEETRLLIENLEGVSTVFRNNHASNYFSFNGTLPKDRESLLNEIDDIKADQALIDYVKNSKWRSL